jgi:hypothetical protein
VPLGPPSSQQLKLAIARASVVTAVKLVQNGLRKHGLHKPGLQQLLPQVIALVPRGHPPQALVLIPRIPSQVLVLVPRTPSQVTALVAQAGAIKITTAVFNVCYNFKLLG